jgi:bacteriocin-like protein
MKNFESLSQEELNNTKGGVNEMTEKMITIDAIV